MSLTKLENIVFFFFIHVSVLLKYGYILTMIFYHIYDYIIYNLSICIY